MDDWDKYNIMRIKEILVESVKQPSDIYPQSKDVGGGKIILDHSIDDFGLIDEFEISYIDKKNELKIKYGFKNGRTIRYDKDHPNGIMITNNPSLLEIREKFIDEVDNIMKNNYENLTISQNKKSDWTMNQIKKTQYESKNNILESRTMSGGLKAAMNRFDELSASYQQHLKMIQSDNEISENQQYMADNGQSSAIPGKNVQQPKKQSAKSKVETLQRR